MNRLRSLILVSLAAATLAWAAESPAPVASARPADFKSWPRPQQVEWLLANMTFAEKIEQLNASPRGPVKSYQQAYNARLELPGFVSLDGPRGPRNGNRKSVGFPNGLTLAATWDVALLEKVGATFGAQTKELGGNQLFGPALNLIRHPQAGRNSEYLSEDPYLAGRLAAATARGIESSHVIATPKHYAANSFETGRFRIDVRVPERVLREIYLPHFEAAIREGGVRSVMSSYNSVNGHFPPANATLLEIPGKEWGFAGYMVSDYGTEFESAAAGIAAGTHVELPGWQWYTDGAIQRGLNDGSISGARLDGLLAKLLELKLDPALFNPATQPLPVADVPAQRALARRAGAEGIVLLKNQGGVLPLAKDKTVALIGPFADSPLLMGNENGSSGVVPERIITIKQALQEQLGAERVTFVPGGSALGENYTSAPVRAFPSRAQYFNNLDLSGAPALERDETSIQKLSFAAGSTASIVPAVVGNGFGFTGQAPMKIGTFPEIAAGQDFSLTFWVLLPDQFPKKGNPVFSGTIPGVAEFDITPAGARVLMRYNRNERAMLTLPFTIPAQAWTQVALVRTGPSLAVWINGVGQAKSDFGGALLAMPIAFGGTLGTDKNATCVIDEFALYDRALTEAELGQLSAKQAVTAGRILYVSCDDAAVLAGGSETYPGITDVKTMSARWTGKFTARRSGRHIFRINSDGGVRFHLDGKKRIDQWQEAWVEGKKRQDWVELEAGHSCEVTVEFANWYAHQRGNGGFVAFQVYEPTAAGPDFSAAVAAARSHDVAVVAVGMPLEYLQGEANDGDVYELPGDQQALVAAVAAANPHTVVVLSTAGGVDMRAWLGHVPAVLEASSQGQEGGYSVADVLTGAVNPSGKLPVSYPVSTDQLEVELVQKYYEDSVTKIGYRMFDRAGKVPQFAFGHGLSYTTFAYAELSVVPDGPGARVRFTVRNTGARAGAEVPQVYVGDLACSVERPVRELKGFAKVFLQPGETRRVELKLAARAFQFWSVEHHAWVAEPGDFKIEVGASSRDLRLSRVFSRP